MDGLEEAFLVMRKWNYSWWVSDAGAERNVDVAIPGVILGWLGPKQLCYCIDLRIDHSSPVPFVGTLAASLPIVLGFRKSG